MPSAWSFVPKLCELNRPRLWKCISATVSQPGPFCFHVETCPTNPQPAADLSDINLAHCVDGIIWSSFWPAKSAPKHAPEGLDDIKMFVNREISWSEHFCLRKDSNHDRGEDRRRTRIRIPGRNIVPFCGSLQIQVCRNGKTSAFILKICG